MIDCGGNFRTWGCGCEHCLPRRHPLDLIARATPEQLKAWNEQMLKVDRSIKTTCISCGEPGRLYAGGRFCDKHKPGIM